MVIHAPSMNFVVRMTVSAIPVATAPIALTAATGAEPGPPTRRQCITMPA